MGAQRQHGLAVFGFRNLADQAQHLRLAGAIDVRIEHADRGALGRQRQGDIGRDRRLADAALARGDGDQVPDTRDRLHVALHAVPPDAGCKLDGDLVDAEFPRQGATDLVGDALVRAPAGKTQLDGHLEPVVGGLQYAATGDLPEGPPRNRYFDGI